MAVSFAANAAMFAMRNGPATGRPLAIYEVSLYYQVVAVIAADALRRLAIFRGTGAAATGGTAIAAATKYNTAFLATSACDAANGGDIRVATTAALGVAGITFEAIPAHLFPVGNVTAAGTGTLLIADLSRDPFELQPGELMAIRAPVAFPAAGTWTAHVTPKWFE